MAKGPTQREMFMRVSAFLADNDAPVDLVEFVDGRIAQLDKRANAPKGMTKEQIANVALKQEILEILANTEMAMTATDVSKIADISVQKATAMLGQLVKTNVVIRDEDGKKVTFRV